MNNSTAKKLSNKELEFSIPKNKIQKLKQNCKQFKIIGQDRAIQAIELGLGITGGGYNIFVMGAAGTGRRTVLSSRLKDYKPEQEKLQDIAYAYNFAKPIEPQALFFPAGKGSAFRSALKKAVESIHLNTLALLKSEVFLAERKKIIAKTDNLENSLLIEFETKVVKDGFKTTQVRNETGGGLDLIPVINGEEIPFEELQSFVVQGKFSKTEFNSLRKKYYKNLDELSNLFDMLREQRKKTEKAVTEHQRNSIKPIIKEQLAKVLKLVNSFETKQVSEKQKYDTKKNLLFLKKVEEDLISKMKIYSAEFKSPKVKKNFFGRYTVNLICEHTKKREYVIMENLPTFTNLFGTIEASSDSELPEKNVHLKIREGAVHKAFGGYLIVRFRDLIEEEDSWVYLKRILQSGKIEIHSPPSANQAPALCKPEALVTNFKVIIIGGEYTYDILYQEDPDFYKLFKVCAEFDSVMQNTDKNIKGFISLVNHLCEKKSTLKVTDSGYSKLITYAANIAGSRHLLTTQFTKIEDLIVEADFIARRQNKKAICDAVLNETIEKRHYLHSLPEEKFTEMIKLGDILISVTGEQVAKINGLAVEERGYHAFGVPVAVTAQASPGDGGIVNIEREAGLSGEIYDKAHLIITSLLRQRFAQKIPLSISASICFEQSYSYIDGDSASCAEFLALISAIGNFPMRQDIAVTGSLNQHGMVQPVGGISEKIEGFFKACKILGFTGKQGVMIPYSNRNNLFLPQEILDATKSGKFSIWLIKTIDEGIELLSGLKQKEYTEKISSNLAQFYELVKKL